jgi:hypothetical protein
MPRSDPGEPHETGKKLVRHRGQLLWLSVGASADEIARASRARVARMAATAGVAASLPKSFDPTDPRPLLLVDVDGVICPIIDDTVAATAAGLRTEMLGDTLVWLSQNVAERLNRLGGSFQLVWCTAWQTRAAELVAPRLGLSALPVITFDEPGSGDCHWKWSAIEAFVRDRAFAWIDDELDERDEARARSRASATLLVRIDPAIGLEDEHVDTLEAFADTEGIATSVSASRRSARSRRERFDGQASL